MSRQGRQMRSDGRCVAIGVGGRHRPRRGWLDSYRRRCWRWWLVGCGFRSLFRVFRGWPRCLDWRGRFDHRCGCRCRRAFLIVGRGPGSSGCGGGGCSGCKRVGGLSRSRAADASASREGAAAARWGLAACRGYRCCSWPCSLWRRSHCSSGGCRCSGYRRPCSGCSGCGWPCSSSGCS